MKTLFRWTLLLLFLAGWALAALALHLVRTPDKVVVITKNELGLTDTYVDARNWTLDQLPDHADLVERIIKAGKADQLAFLVSDAKTDVITQLRSALANGGKEAGSTRPSATHSHKSATSRRTVGGQP